MTHIRKFYLMLSVAALAAGLMLYSQILRAGNIETKPAAKPLIEQNFTEITLGATERPLGNPGAQLLIIGFFDFNEEIDRDYADLIADFVKDNPQAAQFYIKNNLREKLFDTGDRTLPHRALICAGAQKKYWEFLNELTVVKKINDEELAKIADSLKLNTAVWQNCLDAETTKQTIDQDLALAKKLGLTDTPTIFVNNKKINLEEDVNLKDLLNKLIAI